MKFELAKSGSLLIVRVAGELDHHFADEIRMRIDAEIMKPPVKDILFDFNNLSFMDSSGIGVLLSRYKQMEGSGGTVAVYGVGPRIGRILKIGGVNRLVQEYRSREEALGKP